MGAIGLKVMFGSNKLFEVTINKKEIKLSNEKEEEIKETVLQELNIKSEVDLMLTNDDIKNMKKNGLFISCKYTKEKSINILGTDKKQNINSWMVVSNSKQNYIIAVIDKKTYIFNLSKKKQKELLTLIE